MRKLVKIFKNEKATFWILAFLLSGMVGVYLYSLNVAVVNVVKRGVIEKNISSLNNSIAELESSYISLKKNINLDLAYSLGYKEIESTTYIARRSVSAVVSNVRVRE